MEITEKNKQEIEEIDSSIAKFKEIGVGTEELKVERRAIIKTSIEWCESWIKSIVDLVEIAKDDSKEMGWAFKTLRKLKTHLEWLNQVGQLCGAENKEKEI
ncbi:hypothetical protein K9M79_02925 [Candidatus Woesearchaeota archaeon]|nr:hypothetical protein [Candidatus Woesearchaeota archaeon]